jgi:hypothetical protein
MVHGILIAAMLTLVGDNGSRMNQLRLQSGYLQYV